MSASMEGRFALIPLWQRVFANHWDQLAILLVVRGICLARAQPWQPAGFCFAERPVDRLCDPWMGGEELVLEHDHPVERVDASPPVPLDPEGGAVLPEFLVRSGRLRFFASHPGWGGPSRPIPAF